MLFESGELRMVVGARGASPIVTGIAQTVRNIVEYGMSATEAVSCRRVNAEGAGALVEGRFARELDGRLEAQGLEVVRSPDGHERGGAGIVEAIVVREASGSSAWKQRRLDPGLDPRGDGGVAFGP
jgi:gamma-glutamyltranspeptidase